MKGFEKKLWGMMLAVLLCSCAPSRQFLHTQGSRIGSDASYVRVLVHKTADRVTIVSNSKTKVTEIRTQKIFYNANGKSFAFYPEMITEPVQIEAWDAPLSVNGKKYRGMIQLHNVMGKLCVINVLKMNEYLYGVVPSEIPRSWEPEALKAQAVAARTYIYYHIMKTKNLVYDVDATTNFQMYKGYAVESPKTNKAVDDTSQEILVSENRPILSYFHSTCGGHTINAKYVWKGSTLPYSKSVRCTYCAASPNFTWKTTLSLPEIRRVMNRKYRSIGRVQGISFKKAQGRVVAVRVRHANGAITLTGNQFRLMFPPKKIKSMYFRAAKKRNGLVLYGHGWGHGVGMCQWGARGMAANGKSYRDILSYYFTGIKFFKVNDRYFTNQRIARR